jgi:hypothetical protein
MIDISRSLEPGGGGDLLIWSARSLAGWCLRSGREEADSSPALVNGSRRPELPFGLRCAARSVKGTRALRWSRLAPGFQWKTAEPRNTPKNSAWTPENAKDDFSSHPPHRRSQRHLSKSSYFSTMSQLSRQSQPFWGNFFIERAQVASQPLKTLSQPLLSPLYTPLRIYIR